MVESSRCPLRCANSKYAWHIYYRFITRMKTQKLRPFLHAIVVFVLMNSSWSYADPANKNQWQDKDFIKLFTGGYGVRTEIEPAVNPEEARFISTLPKLIDADKWLAIDTIRATQTSTSSPAFDYILGQLYIELDKRDLAIRSYQRAVDGFPNFVRALRGLGFVLIMEDRCSDAQTPLLKLMELGEARGTTFGFLAYCSFQDKRYAEAANYYHMARIYQPEDLDWKIGAANAYIEAGRADEARVLLDDLIETSPDKVDYLMLQTNMWLKKEDRQNAILNLEMIDKLDKANTNTALLLGDLYVQEGAVSLAYPHYKTALMGDKKPSFEQATKAFSYLTNASLWDKAKAYLETLEQVYGNTTSKQEANELLYMQAELALATNKADEAINKLQEVLRVSPLHGEALLLTAEYYFNQREFYQAELFFQRASHVETSAYQGHLGVAKSAAQVGQYQKSIKAYQQADILHPSDLIKRNIATLQRVLQASS